MPARKKSPAQFRAEFLQAINEHKSVTDLCAKFNISRKTYYKWKTISEKENHTESRQPGRKTVIDDRILEMVKELIVSNPEWSVDKIYAEICKANNGEQLVSRRWIQYQLEKNKLSTHAKRRIYSFTIAPQSAVIEPAPSVQVEESITLPKQQIFTAGNSSPPNFYTTSIYNKLHQLYQITAPHISPYIKESYKKQIRDFTTFIVNNPHKAVLTIVLAISNAYLMSIVGNAVINAEGIGQKTGMIFSALALFCGTFFFLYSLKYYITIVAVILQSRSKSQNFQPVPDTNFKAKILNILGSASANIVNKIQAPHTNPIELQQQVVKEQLNEYPFFSVQIPLYNEKKVANRVVAAAVAMDYPNFEVIVCDDSTDETTELLREKWGTHPKVRILHRDQRTGYKGAALDNALKFMDARTDYVVVFDADFVPYPDTLNLFAKYFAVIGRNERNNIISPALSSASQVVNSYSNGISNAILTSRNQAAAYYNKTVALQGYQWHVLNKSENWITRAVRTEFSGSYIIERSGTQLFSLLKQIAGSVYAINATVLKETGWGTSITEDFQLTLKLYEKGYKVAYTPYIQAPSECVSTLKRLIRQRQRWAEGHSHNMKLRLHQLLSSPNMSAKEKWETVYLAPYYLQSFIFIIGTVAWIIAEVIFKVKLPFWTAALGWSLVLTNLFSLPLMNTIGLFLEEGEERDYLGIFSFLTLCYILAPFIGWAALKGFIEKEEGPWFRTPKSGRITDKVERTSERKSERISKYIPWMRPAMDIIRKIVPEVTNPISAQYLAYATAGNTFKNTNWAVRSSKLKKRLVHTIVLFLTGITALTNVLQTSVPQAFANPDTYYVKSTDADNLNSTGTDPRKEGNTTIGSSAQTQTLDGTNTTFYMLTDNLNKRWTNDTKINDSDTNGDRRNVAVATHTDGSTVAVWEDSRTTTTATQDRFDNTRGNVTIARQNAAIAPTDNGKILIAGGIDEAGVFRSSAEIYDPVADTFTLASNHLPTLRSNAEAVTLDDSRVLILGGRSATSTVVSTAQLFNGQTNTAAATGALPAARTDGPAIKLNNGMVLRIGGCSAYTAGACSTRLSAAELFDPGRARWSAVGSLVSGSRANSRAALLPNGEVLVVGGYDGTNRLSTSEIYDPVSATWRRGPSMSVAREEPGVTSLIDGSVLVVGGYDGTNYLSSSELFDPYAQTWTTLTSVHSNLAGTYKPNGLVQLGNGKVLIAGATEATNNGSSTAMVYEPLTKTYALTTSFMQTRRENVSPILTQTGKVLFAGGQQGTASISNSELYTPITYDIYAQKYDKTGAKQWGSGTDIRVNSDAGNRASSTGPSNYNHLNPTVTLDSSGNALVAWEEQRSSIFNSEIWSQKLAASDGAKQWPLGTQNAFAAAPGTITYNRQTNNVSAGVRSNLLSNGRTLITGTETNNVGRSMPELYDPVANTFTVGPMMARPRFGHTATTLLDGRVLLVGSDVSAATGSIAEIFNPVTNTWATTGNNLNGARSNHTGTLMKDGRVLIVAGRTSATSTALSTVQIFNPATGTFAAGAPLLGGLTRDSHAAVSLPNGKVLVVGDQSADADRTAAVLYDPFANTWSAVPGAHQARYFPQLVLLNNGKVLSVGDVFDSRLTTSELYDPALNTWTQSALMNVSRSGPSVLTVLPDGKVLAVGGYDGAAAANVASGEIYDPATNTWSALGTSVGRAAIYNPITYNPIDNKFLILGGTTTGATNADLFTPTGDMPLSAYQFNSYEGYKTAQRDRGSLNNIQYRKPAIALDSDGNATVVWHQFESAIKEYKGNGHTNDANAYRMFSADPTVSGQCSSSDGCGQQPMITVPTVQIVGQKICNAASGCDAGTTTGERQWGTEQDGINKNNPQNKAISNINGAQNTALVNDGTNLVLAYQSNSDVKLPSNKTLKIYAQKIDTNGKVIWSSGMTSNANNLIAARVDSKATSLNSGKILLTSGSDGSSTSTAEVFDTSTNTSTATTNNLSAARLGSQASLLSNGQVLITGGGTGPGVSSTTAQLFTESGTSGSFAATTGGMVVSRSLHTSTPLRDGRVIIAGGRNGSAAVSSSELYTLTTSVFAASGNLRTGFRYNHEAVLMKNGRVLIAGGTNDTGPISSAEFYDPATSTWNAASILATKRQNFTLSALNDGRILAVGGTDGTNILSSVEIYTPDVNSWTTASSLVTSARSEHNAVVLPSGHVVVYGGTSGGTTTLSTSEIYDPTTGTWTAFLNSNIARKLAQMVPANNGKVYIFGGWDENSLTSYSSAEYFSLDQKISVADSTNSLKPDLVKDSDNNFQVVWQAWEAEGVIAGNSGGSWKVAGQKLNNPASGTTTRLWPNGTQNVFSSAASMPGGARTSSGIGMLPNGKILIAGGSDGTTFSTSLLYDPVANTWTSTGNLNTPREGAFLTVLSNGKALIVGGNNGSTYLSTAELYDPATGTWSLTTNNLRNGVRSGPAIVQLNNGKVLVAGGNTTSGLAGISTSELFDPSTNTWTATTGNFRGGARAVPSYTMLPNGQVLVTSGFTGSATLSTSEIYNPATDTWTLTTGSLRNGGRIVGSTIRLNTGKVLYAGGTADLSTGVSTAEIYDPLTQTWTNTSFLGARRLSAGTVSLPSGKILLIGGSPGGAAISSTEIYDPLTATWTAGPFTPDIISPVYHTVNLKDGRVFLPGGQSNATTSTAVSTATLYNPELSEKIISSDDSNRRFNQVEPRIASDSANGSTYVTWEDDRYTSPSDTTIDKNIFMQKVGATGVPLWPNGDNTNGTYNVRDIRVNSTRGTLDTTGQVKPVIGKRVFNDTDNKSVFIAWTDMRDGAPSSNIYGQSFDTLSRSMTSTSWTAYFVLNAVGSGDTVNVQVGANEADGESAAFNSTTGTFSGTSDPTDGEKSIVFSDLPPTGETDLTHKRLYMKITRTGGTMTLRYNGAHNASSSVDADTRLDVGIVVPERTALLGFIIPFLPVMIMGYKRRKYFRQRLEKVYKKP